MAKDDERPLAMTYSRVSGVDDPRTLSLDSQEEAVVALLESKGFRVPRELRLREHYTGMESIHDRPVLVRARELIAAGKVRAFGVYDTDRLARDPKDLLTVVSANREQGVETAFVRMDHETASRVGEMLLYMQGFASAVEYDRIRDRTQRARMKLLHAGKWVGGGKVKYGYVLDKGARTRTAHPETAPIVRRIFALVAGGMSSVAVARLLDDEGVPTPRAAQRRKDGRVPHWTPTVVMDMVKDRTYIGEVVARQKMPTGERLPSGRRRMVARPVAERIRLDDHGTEALVDRDLFDRANAVLRRLRSSKGTPLQRKGATHLLAGYIFCELCGCRMTPENVKRRARAACRVYRCSGHHRNRREPNGCTANIGAGWVEEAAWEAVCRLLDDGFLDRELEKAAAGGAEALIRQDLRAAGRRRQQVEAAIKNVLDAQARPYASATIRDALATKLDELDREMAVVDQQVADLEARLRPLADLAATRASLRGRVARFRERARGGELPLTARREVLEYLGIRVRAAAGGVCKVEASLPVEGGAADCGEAEGTTSRTSSRSPGATPRPRRPSAP